MGLSDVYEHHHASKDKTDFSMLETERGKLFSSWIGTGKHVLDIGCRDGTLTKYFTTGNTVVGLDIDRHMLAKAEKTLGIKTAVIDLNSEWNLNDKYDVIVAAEVVEHLYYPDIVFQKVKAHLKPAGMFIGSVPNAYNIKNRIRYLFGIQRNTPLDDPTHINQFSYKHLRNALKKQFGTVELVGIASGRANKIAKHFPNLGSFMLIWKAQP